MDESSYYTLDLQAFHNRLCDIEAYITKIEFLENHVIRLERQIIILNREERVIVEDAHCLIRFFAKLCGCCTGKNESVPGTQTYHIAERKNSVEESLELQTGQKCRSKDRQSVPQAQRIITNY